MEQYPDEIFVILVSLSTKREHSDIRVIRVPCKVKNKVLTTINGRRHPLVDERRIVRQAEGAAYMVYKAWVFKQEDVQGMVDQVLLSLKESMQYQIKQRELMINNLPDKGDYIIKEIKD